MQWSACYPCELKIKLQIHMYILVIYKQKCEKNLNVDFSKLKNWSSTYLNSFMITVKPC